MSSPGASAAGEADAQDDALSRPDPRFEVLCQTLRAEHPTFRLIAKEESPLMAGLARWLGMRFWNCHFMRDYTTVLVTRVYMPRRFHGTVRGYRTLRHERIHMQDAVRTGVLPFALSYLFLLPAGVTARAYWEWRAYAESLRCELEDTGTIADESLDHIVKRFVGPDYLFMFPFPRLLRARLERLRSQLLAEHAGAARRPL